ncbi:type IX secretion system anionic LPS delivery protein PorZ [Flexibacter flexilis]|nr:T9SS type A sorting domain-containing protein [Flexibacter flexilis]
MKKYSILILLILILGWNNAFSQPYKDIPVGTWRMHFAYNQALTLEETPSRIYTTTANSLFYFDKKSTELTSFTKMDGLSGLNITALRYSPAHKLLVVGYADGLLDFIADDGTITILSDIRRASIIGSKQINNITIQGDYAYLSTAFGLVVLNIAKKEIKESNTMLGNSGTSQIAVSNSALLRDTLYCLTSEGLKYISLSKNILNTTLWSVSSSVSNVSNIITANNKLYLSQNNNLLTGSGNRWSNTGLYMNYNIRSMKLANNGTGLVLAEYNNVYYADLTNNTSTQIYATSNQNFNDALLDATGKYWIADGWKGLRTLTNNNAEIQNYTINSPYEDACQRFYYYNGKMVAMYGGYDLGINAPLTKTTGYGVFENNEWKSYGAAEGTPNMPYVQDLVSAAYSAKDNTLYFASFSHGILTLKDTSYGLINHQTAGSQFVEILNDPNYPTLRISDIKVDNNNNLWAVSYLQSQKPAIHTKPNGSDQWKTFYFNSSQEQFVLDIEIADNNDKWLRVSPRGGGSIIVFNDAGVSRQLTTTTNIGGLPDGSVYCITKDLEGSMWVGTGKGMVVFDNPSTVLSGSVNARLPIIDGRPVLETDVVSAIAIDGGNRKWVGTRTNGIWLFDADCQKALAHFYTENSPLPSDNIMALGINASTGELFVSTDKGICSYRTTATAGTETHENVKIFPNPVKPDFEGYVAISGLVNNATVKITDVSGKLMYETTAQGGTATWNKKNYTGAEAESGVYLVFSSDDTGEQKFVGKVMVVK